MTDPALIEQALSTLGFIAGRQETYARINDQLAALSSDFASRVEMMDDGTEKRVVNLLDMILGDEMASYFLYEVLRMDGGSVTVDGKRWPIRTIADVRAYVLRDVDAGEGKP